MLLAVVSSANPCSTPIANLAGCPIDPVRLGQFAVDRRLVRACIYQLPHPLTWLGKLTFETTVFLSFSRQHFSSKHGQKVIQGLLAALAFLSGTLPEYLTSTVISGVPAA